MAARRYFILTLITGLLLGLPACSESEPPANPAPANPAPTTQAPTDDNNTLEVTIKGETFNLELAMDDATRLQGLSDRDEIAAHGGMLFVFPDEKIRAFVMRRCRVPIDIAYLDAQGEVVWMYAMQVEPDPNAPDYRLRQYNSNYPAQFAIEVRDGTLRRLGLRQGDRIDLPLEDLKGRAQ